MDLPKRHTLAASHLDALRGISAIVVLLEHLRNLLLVDWNEIAVRSPFAKPIYFVTGLGHQAVIVFFVLSGFFISSSVFGGLAKGRWTPLGYAQARLVRLYVVLVPTLLLGLALDRVGLAAFGGSAVYQPGYGHMMGGHLESSLGLSGLVRNLAFLQTITGPVYGSNTALWSLTNEFWYYVAFPLLLFALRPGVIVSRALCLLTGVAVLAFIGPSRCFGFIIWLFGTAVALAPPSRISRSRSFRVFAWTAFLGLIAASRSLVAKIAFDVPIGLAFAMLVWSLTSMAEEPRPLYRRASEFLAGFSYTLYLVHVPFLVLIVAKLVGPGPRLQPTPGGLTLALGLSVVTILFSIAVWSVTERRTDAVRQWVATQTAPKKG